MCLSTKLALVSAVLTGLGDLWYVIQIARRKVTPSATTWLLFEIAVIASFATYLATGKRNLAGNVMNVCDAFGVTAIVVALALCGHVRAMQEELLLRSRQNWREWPLEIVVNLACMIASVATIIFWGLTSEPFAANLMLQFILVIAYLPTYWRLWSAERNTESYILWGFQLVCCGLAVWAALLEHDLLGVVYAGRAFALILGVLALMVLRFR
jgi:hypothetical protein